MRMAPKTPEPPAEILRLARVMHERLRELEGGGREVALTPAVEELLAVDPAYTPRRDVQPNPNPRMSVLEEATRVLRTTIHALMGGQPHPAVYSAPPTAAEAARRRIHREAAGSPTPFTVLLFPPAGEWKAQAILAELPMVRAAGDTEDEALDALREALDVLLTRAYEETTARIDTRGRTFRQSPFLFQPPGEGRVACGLA
jgi:predicted RNase H-like HicB family nuclease